MQFDRIKSVVRDLMRDNNSEYRHIRMSRTSQAVALGKIVAFANKISHI